jgi:hypothetical protein
LSCRESLHIEQTDICPDDNDDDDDDDDDYDSGNLFLLTNGATHWTWLLYGIWCGSIPFAEVEVVIIVDVSAITNLQHHYHHLHIIVSQLQE